eukprot:superscaffoldBa00003785_g17676
MAAAGVRTTKGLYFTLTLLCLVCLASSLTDKDQLAHYESEGRMMNIMEQTVALMKKSLTNVPDDFPPMEGLLESVNGFMEKTKTYLERERAEFDAREKLKESVQRSQQLLDRAKAEYESQMAISERRLDEIMNMEEQDEIVKGIKERAKIYHEMVKETLNAEIG